MRICWAICGFSSMLTLTIRTAPPVARTVFSRIGPSCLHGPHQGAQKSTITGASKEPSTTSVMKVAVVTSLKGAVTNSAQFPVPVLDWRIQPQALFAASYTIIRVADNRVKVIAARGHTPRVIDMATFQRERRVRRMLPPSCAGKTYTYIRV